MTVTLHHGDCLDVLRTLPDASVDAVVTDPPYGLANTTPEQVADTIVRWVNGDRDYIPSGKGFMGKSWDAFVPPVAVWDECLRVLKPGGHLLAFAGSRTHDLMALGIRLAGFDIRDSIAHLYGSGFPKSLDVSKAIDKAAGAEREIVGSARRSQNRSEGWDRPWMREQMEALGGSGMAERSLTAPATDDARTWQGWGTALKPAHEPVVVARKPLAGTVAANVLAHGTGALNVDGCRVEADGEDLGREWTANMGGAFAFNGFSTKAELEAAAAVNGKCPNGRSARATLEAVNRRTTRPAPSGRWPANVVLDESHEPVLRLRYNLPTEVERTIRESFGARTDHLPAVRDDRDGAPEQGGTSEVLHPPVPSGLDVGEPDGREGAEVRQAPHPGDSSEDRSDEAGESSEGRAVLELEGRSLPESGLRLRKVEHPASDRATAVRANGDAQRGVVHPGAPASGGPTGGAPAPAVRGRASHQRREVGQPAGEPGAPRLEQLAPDEARRGRRGDVQAAPGERGAKGAPLEVLRRECPPGWWHYFEVVGHRREGQAEVLDEQSGELTSGVLAAHHTRNPKDAGILGAYGSADGERGYGDTGGASRFFYVAKADASERVRVNGTSHPTVKPLALMRWLVRLVTPPGGTVLEPFAGSGTTVEACLLEGFRCIAIEREADYLPLIQQRIDRRRDPVAAVKTSGEDGGLFDLLDGEVGA